MMEVYSEATPPEAEPDEGDPEVFAVNVSVSEIDTSWHSASHMIPTDLLTPDAIAEALIQCIVGVAAARSPHTLIALQQRLMAWGA